MSENIPKRLLLIGGGDAHLHVLEVLRKRRAEWRDRLQVTLVSRELVRPAGAMLAGLVAGHYRIKETQLDVGALARAAGVAALGESVRQLDLQSNLAATTDAALPFDLVSIDIGASAPDAGPAGLAAHAVFARPLEPFLERWRDLQDNLPHLERPVHVVVVADNAAGVELVLAMACRLQAQRDRVKWSLVVEGPLLAGHARRAAQLMTRHLERAGVALRTGVRVAAVEAAALHFDDGSSAAFDAVVWAAGSRAQPWLVGAGLQCDARGQVLVDQHLRSVSHAHVFAAGDTVSGMPAQVKYGQALAENLLRDALGQPLFNYRLPRPQLSLLSTGPRHAIASWRALVWQGDWVWRLKDELDRRFVRRYSLPDDSGGAARTFR